MGGIAFTPPEATTGATDLLLEAVIGVGYELRPGLSLRADLEPMLQPCRTDDTTGLVCNDGSQLGHASLSAGLHIVF